MRRGLFLQMVSPERLNSRNDGESSLNALDDMGGPAPPAWVMLILPEMVHVVNNLKFLPTYAAAAEIHCRLGEDRRCTAYWTWGLSDVKLSFQSPLGFWREWSLGAGTPHPTFQLPIDLRSPPAADLAHTLMHVSAGRPGN